MTGLVQVADISDVMFNEIEALASQSVTPSKSRNVDRFPEQFRFQLMQTGIEQPATDCDRFAKVTV